VKLRLAFFLAACAGPVQQADRAPEQPPVQDEPTPASDVCEQFNNRPRLSDEEHMRIYGCPPCPCACIDGEIRCAPCAVCQPPNPGPVPPP
jgi:hypothetical protein